MEFQRAVPDRSPETRAVRRLATVIPIRRSESASIDHRIDETDHHTDAIPLRRVPEEPSELRELKMKLRVSEKEFGSRDDSSETEFEK